MLVKFIGVPGEEHEAISMYGYHFPKGEAVDVTDPEAIRRLARHPHFAHKPDKPTPAADAAQLAELQTLTAAAVEPIEQAKAEEQQIAEAHSTAPTEEKAHGNTEPARNAGPAGARRRRGERNA